MSTDAVNRVTDMIRTRREFGRLALAGVAAAVTLPEMLLSAAMQDKPNSKWAGVQVGMNVPWNFGSDVTTASGILNACVQLGVSAIELRPQAVEVHLGLPVEVAQGRGGGGGRGPGRGTPPTPEQIASQKAAADALRKWRLALPMSRVAAVRRLYEDAGVLIQVVKWDSIFTMPNDELEYAFGFAKALGASAVSCELEPDHAKRIGQLATQHKMMVGYHNHAAATPEMIEAVLAQSKYNAANLDLGHFVAGNNVSPVAFIRKHAGQISHVHVKDHKTNHGPSMPLGQGNTPIREILQMMRDNKYTFQATLEFSYGVPPGSTRMAELAKCMEFCKQALLS